MNLMHLFTTLNYILSMTVELEEIFGMTTQCHDELILLREKIYKELYNKDNNED